VAIDHFIGYGKLTPGGGLSNLPDALKKVVAGLPGAVTMSKGTAMNCWEPYAGQVPLILQAGCFTPDDRVIETMTDPEECVRLGADAIAIAIGIFGPNEGKFLRFFADYAAKKWPLSGQQKLGVEDARRICSCSKACVSWETCPTR
jgi:class I fructose-bisphosphate aldolase